MINLQTPIDQVPRIGPAYQRRLKRLGIINIQDLIFYFPVRYDDFSNIVPVSQIKLGQSVCIQGKIIEIKNIRTFKRRMNITQAFVEDRSGSVQVMWFNQPYLVKNLKKSNDVCLAGKVGLGKQGAYLINPAYEKTDQTEEKDFVHTGRLVPIYSQTQGLSSRWLRFVIKPLLLQLIGEVQEILPSEIIRQNNLMPIKKALWQIHFPDSAQSSQKALSRFAFEELFLLQISVLKEKLKLQKKQSFACPLKVDLMQEFVKSLPFSLTDAQRKCSYQIIKDLEKTIPMSRLLQGDVGSGKTVVAAMAAFNVAKNGYQTAFMAPTEILARQHFLNLKNLLRGMEISIGFLTSKQAQIFRRGEFFEIKKPSLLEDLKNGQINILLGTHSLIQKNVEFKDLALIVVDEQHRFGVEQRSHLIKNRKLFPHLLSMTATPIPRTLALTIYGDLDLSLINEMPKNRKKVGTFIVRPENRNKAYEFIRKEVREGRGIFVVCPRIEVKNEKSEFGIWDDVKAVKEEYEKLSKYVFPDLKIGMLYGKMKADEKEKLMLGFQKGEIDILVSTSVVEVGVDVPRATVMMIEGAERFGLAQLHQFRGRVGRSDQQSYCLLFTTSSDQLNRKRLKALVQTQSGFELAEKDLQIRGPGQLSGTQQWGVPDMAMKGLSNISLVEKTRQAAKEILKNDPDLKNYPSLKERVAQFQKKIHFE